MLFTVPLFGKVGTIWNCGDAARIKNSSYRDKSAHIDNLSLSLTDFISCRQWRALVTDRQGLNDSNSGIMESFRLHNEINELKVLDE